RTGLTNKEINMLEKCNSVIYMSCNPHTMIRDLKYFEEKGYRIERLIPYDMFPQTYHIEMLSLLKK
ncbi:23S rRNA (uracil(1939)-C(5))-methyltransferase RlmD, partial [Metamycoplasma hominis]